MNFVLDSNVWISERLLRSAVGSAFLHAIRRLNARIVVPDSTKDEIIANAERLGLDAVNKVNDGFRTVQILVGTRPDYEVPSRDEFRHAAFDRLLELGGLILPYAVSMEHHQRALARVNEKRPPATESRENYRDCLLWEIVVDKMSEGCSLVSLDHDFSDKSAKGTSLARALVEESKGSVAFYPGLKEALQAIEPQLPPIDIDAIASAITDQVLPFAKEYIQERHFTLGQQLDTRVKLYATEDPSSMAAIFETDFSVFDLSFSGGVYEEEARLTLSGQCKVRDADVENLFIDSVEPFGLDGSQLPGKARYVRTIIAIGVEQHPYRVRTRVPGTCEE